jgi:PhzF family phenazine biosynthesis protein
VRAIENKLETCTVLQRIGIGILPVDVVKEDRDYKIIMTQGAIEISEEIVGQTRGDILGALGLGDGDMDERFPVKIASTGHSKVMVGIKRREKLNSLAPDLSRLTNISGIIGCNGYFVFTFDSDDSDILSHGRMFAPAIGIPEDPVTGNANGPLGAYLVHHGILKATDGIASFKGKQGEAIGRPGIVEVTVEAEGDRPTKVKVGGCASVAFKTEIEV